MYCYYKKKYRKEESHLGESGRPPRQPEMTTGDLAALLSLLGAALLER